MSWREEKNRTQNKTGRSLSRILLLGTQSASEITVQNAALTNRQPLVSQSCDPPLFVCAIMKSNYCSLLTQAGQADRRLATVGLH